MNKNSLPVIEEKTLTEKEKPFNIEIKYPFVAGLDEFNQKIEDIVNKQLNEFKKISLENDQAVKEIDPESYAKYPREYAFNVGYTKGKIDENTASIVLNIYSFTGGAHGATNFIPINYDIKNKKEIKLADLFAGQKNYLQKISDYCAADLTKQMKETVGEEGFDASWMQEGTAPKEENYSIFLINPSTNSGQATLTFYFPQYQVASYAAGYFEVVMPIDTLQ